MALKDKIAFGMSLPHRSPDPIDVAAVRAVAQRAEALGFSDLWVTENTLDHVTCFDPVVVLTYAAAVTRRIRLGASVVVLAVHSPMMVAHQWATLDHLSNGRAILGVGLGREHHYREFAVPEAGRVAPVPRRGGADQGAVDAAAGHLSRSVLPVGRCDDGAQAGAATACADLDGRRPSQRHPARGIVGGRLDGIGRVEHRGIRPVRAVAAGRAGGGGTRSGRVSDLETDLRGGGRTSRKSRAPNCSLVHRGLPQPGRAPTHRACTAHRRRCASGWRRSSPWAPTTCC